MPRLLSGYDMILQIADSDILTQCCFSKQGINAYCLLLRIDTMYLMVWLYLLWITDPLCMYVLYYHYLNKMFKTKKNKRLMINTKRCTVSGDTCWGDDRILCVGASAGADVCQHAGSLCGWYSCTATTLSQGK